MHQAKWIVIVQGMNMKPNSQTIGYVLGRQDCSIPEQFWKD